MYILTAPKALGIFQISRSVPTPQVVHKRHHIIPQANAENGGPAESTSENAYLSTLIDAFR